MTRVAALDCGTNSLRLLVADVDRERDELRDLDREMRIVRLGEGVDATGRLASAALDRTFAALDDYAATIRTRSVERVRMVATSATRDAANRSDFVAGVRARLGADPEVLTGQQEAALSFAGATRELDPARFAPPYLVVDIGGGSTEFVLGTDSVEDSISVDIGCVRLTERHLRSDPPTATEISAAEADIDRALDAVRAAMDVTQARTLVGLAGSVTTVAALALGLDTYDAARIHHARVTAGDIEAIASDLLAATRWERAALPVMHPGRVDVIGAGALVLSVTCARFGVPVVVASEHDILDGIAWSIA